MTIKVGFIGLGIMGKTDEQKFAESGLLAGGV